LVGVFKTKSTKQINQLLHSPGHSLWQRGFYDRIVRNEKELDRIRRYIEENPLQWELDRYHPSNQ
jgi:putative transposase